MSTTAKPKRRSRHVLGRIVVIAAISTLPAACASGDGSPVLSVSDIEQDDHFYEGEYLGEPVTVEGVVDGIQSAHALNISEGGYGDEKLLVLTTRPIEVTTGEPVRVIGTAGQVRKWFPSEGLPYYQRNLYDQSGTTAYVYDAVVVPTGG